MTNRQQFAGTTQVDEYSLSLFSAERVENKCIAFLGLCTKYKIGSGLGRFFDVKICMTVLVSQMGHVEAPIRPTTPSGSSDTEIGWWS